jgi:hypothetical protein
VDGDLRVERAVGHALREEAQVTHPRAGALELVEHAQAVQAGARKRVERAHVERRLLARRVPEAHDDAPRRHASERGGEAGAAHRLEDGVEAPAAGRELADHLVGPDLRQPLRALGRAGYPRDVRPAGPGQLDRKAAHAARRARYQHAPPQQRSGDLECPDGCHARHRERGRGLEAHVFGQRRQAIGPHRRQLGPRALRHQADHALPLSRPAAVGRLTVDDTGHVPAVDGALLALGQIARLTAVERNRPHGDERLAR